MKLWIQSALLCTSLLLSSVACEAAQDDSDTTATDTTDGTDALDMTDGLDGEALTDALDATDASDMSDATDAMDMLDATDAVDATDATDTSVTEYPVIEFEDNLDNPTLGENCDPGGGIESPGADIDAASLEDFEGTLLGYLAGCAVLNPGSCENDNSNPANAEGEPDLPSGEVLDTYTSLNGGLMRCAWEEDLPAISGDRITVYEVGKATGTTVETYAVRLCQSIGGDCTSDSTQLTGEAAFDVDDLLQ